MATGSKPWQKAAEAKRAAIDDAIPKEWRLESPIPPAEEQRDVTGRFVCQYLSKQETEITETDAVGIVEKTSSGQWSAVEVTKAFCHRAALAHQMVYLISVSDGTDWGRLSLHEGQLPPRNLF